MEEQIYDTIIIGGGKSTLLFLVNAISKGK